MSLNLTCFTSVLRKAFLLICFLGAYAVQGNAQTIQCPPNIDFETGTLSNWTFFIGDCCPLNAANNQGPVINRHTLTTGAGTDFYGGFPVVAPGGGNYSFKLGNDGTGAQAERAQYIINVPVGANNYSFTYAYAAVMQDPVHPVADQPRFEIKVYDAITLDTIPCAQNQHIAGAGGIPPNPGFTLSTQGSQVWYKPWTLGTIDLSGQGGKSVIVDFATGDCGQGAHFGYAYFDLIACGAFEAPVTSCDLEGTGGVTFTAPPGFQAYGWYTPTWTLAGTGQVITLLPPATPTYYNLVLVPFAGNGCPDTIQTQMVANVLVNATPDTLCNTAGVPVQLNAGASGGIGTLTYNWTPSSGLSCTTCAAPLASPNGSIIYYVQVTDTNGCSRRDTLQLLESIYTVDAGPDRVTCVGTPITLNASVTPPSAFYVANWTPATGLSNASVINPVFTPTTPGTEMYILTVDSSYCSKVDTMYITTLPNDFNINDTSICKGGIVQVNAQGDPAFTYKWTPGIGVSDTTIINPVIVTDTTRTYVITASYPTCPDIVKTMTVEVQPLPTVNLGPDTAKCQWDELTLIADVEPRWYNQYTFEWAYNSGLSVLNAPKVVFSGGTDTFLILKVSTPNGCNDIDTINVVVREGNFATLAPLDTAICPRNVVQFRAEGGETYNWVPSLYLDDATLESPLATPVTGAKYTVYVTDQYGCTDTLHSSITVHPDAVLELGDSLVIYPGESVQINPTGNALYYQWFPPAGLSKTNIANPMASPAVNTRYFVSATTESGCVVSDSIDIIVRDDSHLDIPNAFSPGAAPNDVFKISRRGIATLKSFKVFNRWGNVMFETTNIDEGWDGRYKGNPQPMGVYIYMVDAVTNTGRRFTKQGNVTLIR